MSLFLYLLLLTVDFFFHSKHFLQWYRQYLFFDLVSNFLLFPFAQMQLHQKYSCHPGRSETTDRIFFLDSIASLCFSPE